VGALGRVLRGFALFGPGQCDPEGAFFGEVHPGHCWDEGFHLYRLRHRDFFCHFFGRIFRQLAAVASLVSLDLFSGKFGVLLTKSLSILASH
jgi:hypothetical protein